MSDVFISYASQNEAKARQVAEALRAQGLSVWRDEDLPPHRPFSDVIEERLREAKAVLVVWSAAAVASQWVRAEADFARNATKLVQVSIDGALPPLPFNQIHSADLSNWRGDVRDPHWLTVVDSIAALVGAEPPAVTTTPPSDKPASAKPGARAWAWAAAAVAALALVGVGYWIVLRPRRETTTPTARFQRS